MMRRKNTVRILFILMILVFTISCDQISKHIVRQKVEYNAQINVVGNYVILTKVENTGAFLGLGAAIPRPLYKLSMIILPLIAVGCALFYLIKKDLSKYLIVAISLIIGGGLGNIYDRILYGSVTDFLYFDFVIFHTGIVNMADIFVTLGFFMIIPELFFSRKEGKHKAIKDADKKTG
jgi:signal peptidase II